MPYIGNPIYQSAFVTDQFSGDGTTTAFTMSVAPAGVTNVLVAVSGVLQDPSTYGVVGNTITFSAAPPSGTGNISCRYLGVPASGVTTTAYRTVTEFTATASQTTFTPPSYNVGFINVYLNGVLLGSADYTATNGTTVVLATGASAGNLVTVESFRIESVANAIPNAAGAVSSSNLAGGIVTDSKLSLTTPALGTPSSLVLTNATGLPRTALPTGSVLQVVTGTYDSTLSTNSTSFNDLISLNITPTTSSSKILVSVNLYAAGYGAPKVLRNSTAIVSPAVNYALYYASPAPTTPYQSGYRFMYPFQAYDSPATTSSITYKLQVQGHDPSVYLVINPDTSNNYNTTSPAQSLTRMTLMEIAG